jgi:large subunit ribosomal protein LP0
MTRTRPAKKLAVGGAEGREYAEKKVKYFAQVRRLLDEGDKIMIVHCDNVQSKQMADIRASLRGIASVLMGKNTQIKRIMADMAATGNPRYQSMYDKIIVDGLLHGNVGFVITKGDLQEVKKVIDKNKIQAPARQGAVAPLDVMVPAGNTGLEPTKTSFFQALNINTKITKGTVEILKDESVIKAGQKVGSSEATLLQMLNIKPFFYGLIVQKIYDNGSVYGPEILEMTDEIMKGKFMAGVDRVTALSLATGLTTKASLPHVFMNAFKRTLSISLGTDYTFKACDGANLKAAILSGKSLGGGAPAASAPAAGKAAAAAPAPKVEEEEEDGDMGFDLFGGM